MRQLTQRKFAELTGFDQEYISMANNGIAKPSAEYRQKAAEVLELSQSELFDMGRV